jgi:branched-chain amino acid transport system permease protein
VGVVTLIRFEFLRILAIAAVAGAILLAMPFVLPPYMLFILSHALVFSIACLGLNLLFGTAGLLSLGHATYFGAGAYTGAFLYRFFNLESLAAYLLSGVLCAAVLAAAIGFLCVRATKIHFAILTLAFSMVVYSLFIDGAVFRLFGPLGWALYLLTGGSLYVPRLTIFGTEYSAGAFIPMLYNVIVAAFLVSILVLWRISRSPFGLALRGIRDSDSRAVFIGLAANRLRWYAFILSGTFVGLAGGLYGPLARQITPEQLHWLFSATLVLATVIGGTRRFLGPVLGAFVFVILDEIALGWTAYHRLVFGTLLIVVVFAFPGGLADMVAHFGGRLRRRGKD